MNLLVHHEFMNPYYQKGDPPAQHVIQDQSQFDAILVALVAVGKSREVHHHWNGVPLHESTFFP